MSKLHDVEESLMNLMFAVGMRGREAPACAVVDLTVRTGWWRLLAVSAGEAAKELGSVKSKWPVDRRRPGSS